MRHLRKDYDHVQPWPWPSQRRPRIEHDFRDDEPVFLLRAKDPVAAQAIRSWAWLAERVGTDPATCERVREWADEMDAYRLQHWPDKRFPDTPSEMLRPTTEGEGV